MTVGRGMDLVETNRAAEVPGLKHERAPMTVGRRLGTVETGPAPEVPALGMSARQ